VEWGVEIVSMAYPVELTARSVRVFANSQLCFLGPQLTESVEVELISPTT
jgi:hypothetical protein